MIKNTLVICAVLMASVAFAETAQVQRSNSGGSGMAAKMNVQKQQSQSSATQMAMDADKDAEKAMLDMKNVQKETKKTVQMSNSGGSAMARSIQTK